MAGRAAIFVRRWWSFVARAVDTATTWALRVAAPGTRVHALVMVLLGP
jgi:hypothetical protein